MSRLALRCILTFASMILLSPLSHAQVFRAYLSVSGSDSNPCTVALPCRLLPAAINAVASTGEVWMLDSANFNSGTVTISKSVTILALPGQIGSIVAVGGSPAIVTAGTAVVKLRNVVIATNAVNPGTEAIRVASGTSLSLEESVVDISTGSTGSNGVNVSGGAFSAANTTFRGTFAEVPTNNAIYASGNAQVDVSNSRFFNWERGVWAQNNVNGTVTSVGVTNCVMTHVILGVYVWSGAATQDAKATVMDSTFMYGEYGAAVTSSGGVAVLSVGGSMFTAFYGSALYNLGGGAVLESLGTNVARNNNNATSGTITTVPRI